jgi:hypothetical protein
MSGVSQIVLFIVGLGLVFFGLPIFKGALSFFGFLVGAVYGIIFFSLFVGTVSLSPILIILLAAGIGLVGGLLGMALANFANSIFVFIAGGLIALAIAKLLGGFPVKEISDSLNSGRLVELLHPQMLDLVWFVVGGIVFVLAIDTVMTVALVVLGSVLIYQAIGPLHLMEPGWVIPAAFGVIGLPVQESLRHRMMKREKVIIVKRSMY